MNFQQNPTFSPQKLSGVQNSIGKNLFRLDDVSIEYGNIHALKNIKLSIEAGEIIFVTGVSGAGKTTLLKLLSGDLS